MVPKLTREFLVVLNTERSGPTSAVAEIGLIKGLEDFLAYSKQQLSVMAIGANEVIWRDPEWVDAIVAEQFLEGDGSFSECNDDIEYLRPVREPSGIQMTYAAEIFESLEGVILNNRSVLHDLATNYAIEHWEVVKTLPGHMVLSVYGAKLK